MAFIALRILMADRAKVVAIAIGMTFAAMIMAQQPAMMLGMMAQTSAFLDDVGAADVWVMSPAVESVDDNKPMPAGTLYRVRGVPGVEWAVPLYKGMAMGTLPDGNRVAVEVIGIDHASLIGLPAVLVEGRGDDIRRPRAVLIQAAAADRELAWHREDGNFTPLAVGNEMELNDHRMFVAGLVHTTPTLLDYPTLYTTYSRAVQLAPPARRDLSFVLVKARHDINPVMLARRITDLTGHVASTKEDFKARTQGYYWKRTGIPFSFGLMAALGFMVGAVIAGQSFFNFARDNIRQFATLKALGTRDRQLVGMVLLQGGAVGLVGWGIGIGLAALSGMGIEGGDVGFLLTWKLLALSALGVVAIVATGAAGSLWTVLRVEPGIAFRT